MKTLTFAEQFTRKCLRLPRLIVVWFALSPTGQAQLSPAPDGGYPGNNTAEGTNALFNLTNGSANTAVGFRALFNPTDCSDNTAIGYIALQSNATGGANTALGSQALSDNTRGDYNTATGFSALQLNTTGTGNTATGVDALVLNTTGNINTANGVNALSHNNGNFNTANGGWALSNNITGNNNTANGYRALCQNTTGYCNTANGSYALNSNTTAIYNTATGVNALSANTTGNANTATGVQTLQSNTIGIGNTATGVNALVSNTTGDNNTASGIQALYNNTTGSNNIALGTNAGSNLTTGSNNIDIGAAGVAADAGKIRIGTKVTHESTFIAGIRGVTVASGIGVIVGTTGQLGTVVSSARFKEAIKPMDKASEAILALKPVTFRYKEEIDPDKIPQFGLVAEEVEKINPDLVAHDEDGKVMTVRYEVVNAMLLNEFLKEHRSVEEQRNYFEAKIVQQQKQIEALTATVQKVNARLERTTPASPLLANSR